jgi:hypothetical protein
MFLLCHLRGKQVTLNFSSIVACAICEKKIIIKKLHFLNMFFFQCLIIILEKCLSLYTDLKTLLVFPSIFFPYFFQTATFEILRYLFSAYHFPVLVQISTFEILRYLCDVIFYKWWEMFYYIVSDKKWWDVSTIVQCYPGSRLVRQFIFNLQLL